MHPDKHSVFIVCGQQLIRVGITLLVNQQPDLEVIGGASDCKDAEPLLRAYAPKVVILIADADPAENPVVVSRLKAVSPQARLLVMADANDALMVRQILKAGASGYLLTSAPPESLLQAIHSLAAGGSYIDSKLIVGLIALVRPWRAEESEEQSQLSKREKEVLRLVMSGYRSREIADQLSISSKTVDTYCARAMKKLALHSRQDVIKYGIIHGWPNEGPKLEKALIAG